MTPSSSVGAEAMIAEAERRSKEEQNKCRSIRKKYFTLRSQTMQSIQLDINKLQELAFELSKNQPDVLSYAVEYEQGNIEDGSQLD